MRENHANLPRSWFFPATVPAKPSLELAPNSAGFLEVPQPSNHLCNLFVTIGPVIAADQQLANFEAHEDYTGRRKPGIGGLGSTRGYGHGGSDARDPNDLRLAIEAGARWFRLPCGYRQRPHVQNSRAVRQAAREERTPVRLLLDLPSSRPRTGLMQELRLKVGEQVIFWDPETTPHDAGRNGFAHVPLPGLAELLSKLRPSHRMWFCDGRLGFLVDEVEGGSVLARVQQGTIPLKASNSIFLPDTPTPLRSSPRRMAASWRHWRRNNWRRTGLRYR